MALSELLKSNREKRTFDDFVDVDQRWPTKAAFETAIQTLVRIPNGWFAFCDRENNWFKANKATGKAELIGGDVKKEGGNNFIGNQSAAGAFNSTTRTANANLTQNVPGNVLFTGGNFNAHVSNDDYLSYGSRPTFGFTIDGLYGAAIYLRSNVERGPLWFEVQDINGKTDKLALLSDIISVNSSKRDKLETFVSQSASFNLAADMVDKIIRCSSNAAAIVATIADDTLFAIGARFEIRQSNIASVSLAAASGITLNAPQGLVLNRRYSYMEVVKQAVNVYSVTINGDDPTKVDAVANKGLSTNDYTTAEKSKLSAILSGFNILFTAPRRDLPGVYFDKAAKVTAITLNGASALSYSINGGTSYITPTLPLTAQTAITLPAGVFVKFRITYMSNVTDATAYLKFE